MPKCHHRYLIGTDNTARKLVEASKSSISACATSNLHPLADRIQHRRTNDDRPPGIITDVNKQMEASPAARATN
jgi:hypothetical protein